MYDSALIMSILRNSYSNTSTLSGINSLPLSFDVSCMRQKSCKSALKSVSITF